MSWYQLKALQEEIAEQRRRSLSEPPNACPIDGAILDVNARGVRNCRMGNFTWTGGAPPQPNRT